MSIIFSNYLKQALVSNFVAYLKNASQGVNTMIHTFDHTIKPILLYSGEVWGMVEAELKKTEDSVIRNPVIEKINVKFCKYLLGINKKASNLAVRGELGRYPLFLLM